MHGKSEALKYFNILLEAMASEPDLIVPPEHNEYGHPFNPEKDFIRGPRVVNITMANGKAIFDIYRPKIGPKASKMGMCHYHMEFKLGEGN